MDHSLAKKIYEAIRNEPYLVSTEVGVEAPNCYFKGLRLIRALGELGYAVKARLADIDWTNTPIPTQITSLIPNGCQERHFYIEVLIDNEWRTLDPSIDPATAKLGFRMVDFAGDDKTCFDLDRIYTHEEQVEFMNTWGEGDSALKQYFFEMHPFLLAANKWLKEKRDA